MNSQHGIRELALKALYSADFNGFPGEGEDIDCFPALSEAELEHLTPEQLTRIRFLVAGTIQELPAIDALIEKYSENRSLASIHRVDRAILRLSIFTMLHDSSVPPPVMIDEAVKLSQEYSSDITYRFINGILDTIRLKEL